VRNHPIRLVQATLATLCAALVGVAAAAPAAAGAATTRAARTVDVRVLAPGRDDVAGRDGAGFVVDVAVTARHHEANELLSAGAGYRPFFNDPTAPTFLPGQNGGAPGLVVLLSTTPDTPGSPFHGPRTNLAGLFQINGVTTTKAGLARTWNTWQIGKAAFGAGPATLTVYVVRGAAPGIVPEGGLDVISNTVRVPFTITAPAGARLQGS
jgi:hypothetical protein